MIDPPPIQVSCGSCGRKYLVDPELVPPKGARVACRRCGHRFTVYMPGTGLTPAHGARSPTVPPEALQRRPLRAWVFPDDPALQRPGVLPAVQNGLGDRCRIEVVTADTRPGLSQQAYERDEWPDTVVFGDMHVLLEDRLLRAVATRPGVYRVLVSTHHNPDLVRVAEAYCGFDRHLTLPLLPSEIALAFGSESS